ncbi:hypothetical protein C440_13289 [Haloferax mucosum ATCC BAA-1512]|uniref:Uncharacterized protein n=1 Tax=Haloferax mucosum ATCC BAA-1512 TaxID=662479 RepID=M0I3B8_9EURY|nr:hypothetical protein [Haloferax mucosum]ELZ91290.1 hypothetical protein C440_13289 [Haloferax mucosum ATCC BAA-1512]
MSTLVLDYPPDSARILVKTAFELTDGIQTYHDAGVQITGKTGGGLSSYGEVLTVEIPEQQPSAEQTTLSVRARREVSVNVTAQPERYKERYLETLNDFRGQSIERIFESAGRHLAANGSKEVISERAQADGTSKLTLVVLAMVVLSLFTVFLPLVLL